MVRGFAVLVVLAAALSACAGPLTLEERFRQVAVYDEETGEEWPILKRTEDIRLWVVGATETDMRLIDAISYQITEATGLLVKPVRSQYSANVQIRFVDAAKWAAHQRRSPYRRECAMDFYNVRDDDPLAIVRIPDSLKGNARTGCISQELAHSTGLSFDVNGARDTVFGDRAGAHRLMPVDYTLLAILYDPRITNGMAWEEAAPLVRQIVAEMEAAGEL